MEERFPPAAVGAAGRRAIGGGAPAATGGSPRGSEESGCEAEDRARVRVEVGVGEEVGGEAGDGRH